MSDNIMDSVQNTWAWRCWSGDLPLVHSGLKGDLACLELHIPSAEEALYNYRSEAACGQATAGNLMVLQLSGAITDASFGDRKQAAEALLCLAALAIKEADRLRSLDETDEPPVGESTESLRPDFIDDH